MECREQFWDKAESYKRTHKKKYEVTACMPPEGTPLYDMIKGINCVTSNEQQFVIIGTVGEKSVIDVNRLCQTYFLPDGRPLSKDILSRMVVPWNLNGQNIPFIGNFKIVSFPGPKVWAVQVPSHMCIQILTARGNMLTINTPGIPHGSGDYIVCSDYGDAPNLNDRWVENGKVFPTTYDMRAFPNSD